MYKDIGAKGTITFWGEPFPLLDVDECERVRARSSEQFSRSRSSSVFDFAREYTVRYLEITYLYICSSLERPARYRSSRARSALPSMAGALKTRLRRIQNLLFVRDERDVRKCARSQVMLLAITVLDRPRSNHSHDRRRSRGTLNFAFRSETKFLRATVRVCSILHPITSPITTARLSNGKSDCATRAPKGSESIWQMYAAV